MSGSVVVAGLDDLLEGGFQGGATDEEAVDVGVLNQLGGVLFGHGAAIQDASFVGN